MKAGDVGADIERGLWFTEFSPAGCVEADIFSGFKDRFLVFRGFLLGDRERV